MIGSSRLRIAPRRKLTAELLAGSTAILFASCSPGPDTPLRVVSGLVSHVLCSETFVAGLNPDRVFAERLKAAPGINLIHWALHYEVDGVHQEVRTTLAGGFESRAVYRDGLGCVLVQGAGAAAALKSEGVARHEAPAPARLPEIAGAGIVQPQDAKLAAALDGAFAEPDGAPFRRTKAIVIVHDGRVIAERYAPGYGVNTPLLSWSAAKSVTSALIGILVRQGRLAADQPAPVSAWQSPGDPRHAITIDMLLRMKSGLALDETNTGFDPNTRMLFLEPDMARYAESVSLEAPPGSAWRYMSGNYIVLSRIVRDAAGGHAQDVRRFAQRELFDPLRMHSVTLEFDAAGTPIGSSYLYATARDWARFGMLYLDDGVVNGQRILPAGWVAYSAAPTAGAEPGYGAGFWTNRGTSKGALRRVGSGMPPDSFFAQGREGQFVVVVPSERLVVARFGVTHRYYRDNAGVFRLVGQIIAALKDKSR